ncbi:hypothetical protein CAMRE0001_1974 [Campylobacter rectus RM3267]|uniref:Uncharacterized protein n=1 Tax=Campylobacter rectus RM3267 TaxID=553218 RepID=B9CYY2_CAMRE|nr:hypothetical protein CAMRE0001_1974 [Campylobacter rectus RM3267]
MRFLQRSQICKFDFLFLQILKFALPWRNFHSSNLSRKTCILKTRNLVYFIFNALRANFTRCRFCRFKFDEIYARKSAI